MNARGDQLNWVASSSAGPNDLMTVDVQFVGGTGLLDDATGAFSTTFKETLSPTADPLVIIGTFDVVGTGPIRSGIHAQLDEADLRLGRAQAKQA